MTPSRRPGLPTSVLAWFLAALTVEVGIALLLLGWLPR